MLNRTEVKKRMEELNMTQQTLADAIGVSQPMVTHILIGRKQPSLALGNIRLQADIAGGANVV
jgi:predicted transcriptional regulator